MKTIYKSQEGKRVVLALYDKHLKNLTYPVEDIYLDTSFGKTHVIETGNPKGEPLLLFHGGNATSAQMLLQCEFLLKEFHIYAVDTIGHPGKSAEISLSPGNYDYGKWGSEVISGLEYDSISCFGGSFGGGVLAKTMCVAPEKIKKSVLYIPAGIKNAPAMNLISMAFPMMMFWVTKKEEWLLKSLLPMALTEDNIDDITYETAKASVSYSKVKAGMPSDVDPEKMKKCKASTLVIASEKDCLFPASRVIAQAKKMLPNCTTYTITDRGHMHQLTEKEKEMIVHFLK